MTYANVLATLALVFAMGGSAVAASHYLITSKKQISPKVLREIAALGKPGPKGTTGAQGPAGVNGTNGAKGEPGNPGQEGQQGEKGNASLPAVTWNKKITVPGSSEATPATVAIETIGPFKLIGRCWEHEGKTIAATYVESTEEGAVFAETGGEEEEIEKGVPIPVGVDKAESLTSTHEAAFVGPYEGPFSAQSKSGAVALNGVANEAVFLGGKASPACYFSGSVTEEK